MPPSYYTVETQNKFAFLDSDSGEEDATRPAPASMLGTETKRGVTQTDSARGGLQTRGGRVARGGERGSPRGGRAGVARTGQRGGRVDALAPLVVADDSPFTEGKDEDRRQRRPRGAVGARGRGREFDRHSGTGRGREMKKEGGGAHNWGRPGEDDEVLPEEEKPAVVEELEVAEEPSVEEKSTEPAPLTLDEYARLQEEQRAQLPQLPRSSIPKKELLEELTREGFEEYVSSKANTIAAARDDSDEEDRVRRSKKTMSFYELTQQNGRGGSFANRRGGRGARGGRGFPTSADRPSGPAGSPEVAQAANLNLTDKSAFPSLAPKA